jgi:hypothetical protein
MRNSFYGRIEVTPSEQAIAILDHIHSQGRREWLMLRANSGSHVLNAYHNTLHELQNVYYSHSCFVNEVRNSSPDVGLSELSQASLFHDHNHSGGLLSDDRRNVERAVVFAGQVIGLQKPAIRVIECTQFVNGEFPIEPTNLAERCIRDADLMTIYSQEGFRLMIGLFEEMSGQDFKDFSLDQVRIALSKTENFLFAQTMYTDHGNRMRDEHLLSQLRKFSDYAWQQHHYVTMGRREDKGTPE